MSVFTKHYFQPPVNKKFQQQKILLTVHLIINLNTFTETSYTSM